MADLHVMRIKGGGYLNLKVVDISLVKGKNVIGGKNKNGKSNIMSLVEMFQGKAYMPEIAKGLDARKGAFEIFVGDGKDVVYTVKYSFTAKNEYIKVFDAEGVQADMDVLKNLLSPCLNPWEFYSNATATGNGATAARKKAIAVIKPLMKIDFDDEAWLTEIGFAKDAHARSLRSQRAGDPMAFLDDMDKYLGEKRKAWKEDVIKNEGAQAKLEDDLPPEGSTAEFTEVSELLAEQAMLQEQAIKGGQAVKQGEMMEQDVMAAEDALATAKHNLEAFRKEHEDLQSDLKLAERMEKIKEEIESIGETNKMAQKVQDLKELDTKVANGEKQIEAHNVLIEDIRDKKVELLESAKMPVKGLSIEGDVIMKDGLPLGQDSAAEGLHDAFMIALAKFEMAAEGEDVLKTLLIPNAILMDSESRDLMYKMADENGVQLILEMVMDEDTGGVIFVEDGVAKTEAE